MKETAPLPLPEGDALPDPDVPDDRRSMRWVMLGVIAVIVVGAVVAVAASIDVGGDDATTAGSMPSTSAPSLEPEVKLPVGGDPMPAPDFAVTGLDGTPHTLTDYKGTPLVLNFWASWCQPCRKELPAFDEVATELDGQVGFLGVATQDRAKAAKAFAEDLDVGFPYAFDQGDKAGEAYGLYGLPSTYFIDANGQLLDARYGELDADELRKLISELYPDLPAPPAA